MVFVWLRKLEIPKYICGSTYPEKANYIVHIDTRQEQLTELGLQCYKLVDVVSYEMVKSSIWFYVKAKIIELLSVLNDKVITVQPIFRTMG